MSHGGDRTVTPSQLTGTVRAWNARSGRRRLPARGGEPELLSGFVTVTDVPMTRSASRLYYVTQRPEASTPRPRSA